MSLGFTRLIDSKSGEIRYLQIIMGRKRPDRRLTRHSLNGTVGSITSTTITEMPISLLLYVEGPRRASARVEFRTLLDMFLGHAKFSMLHENYAKLLFIFDTPIGQKRVIRLQTKTKEMWACVLAWVIDKTDSTLRNHHRECVAKN